MATKLEKELKREIDVDGVTYVVSIAPQGIKVTPKRHRTAVVDTTWKALVLGGKQA